MKKLIILGMLAFVSPALASGLTTDTVLGTDKVTIEKKLTDMGYEVRKSEMDDGDMEFYIVKDGKMSEVYVSLQTGKIIKVESK